MNQDARLSIRVEPELLDRLRKLAEQQHTSFSNFVRQMLWRTVERQETSTMTTTTYTYTVIEDNGGGLHLFVWDKYDDDNAPSYAFHNFERQPGVLVEALDYLDAGDDPALVEGASETPVEDWMAGADGRPGYVTVCHNHDGERVLLTDGMGTAAQIEFGVEAA